MAAPFAQTSFAKGEIAPSLFGHVDLAAFHTAASTMRNLFAGYRGGAYSRAGTRYVGRSKQKAQTPQFPPRLIDFQFSISQTYVLEFGDQYIRFITNGGFVVETAFNVTAASNAKPCVLTIPGNNYAAGDWLSLSGVFLALGGQDVTVTNVAGNLVTIADLDGNPIDSTAFGAFAAGTSSRIYTITSPYAASDLPLVKWTQSADVMSLAHPNYPPQELTRLGPANWTIAAANFGATISAPGSASVSATVQPNPSSSPPTKPTAYALVVTAVDPKTGQESVASPIANVTNSVDIAATAGSLDITWAPVPGAGHYNIYQAPASYNTQPASTSNALPVPVGSLFGYIGSAFGEEFINSNITPDFTITPPLHQNPFAPGQVLYLTPTAGGTGYTHATATMVTATGSGASFQCVIQGTAVVGYVTVSNGQLYAPADTVTISGDGTGATATPNIGPQSGTYPGVAAYFQERRVYAQTLNNPDTYFMSQPGAFLNFDASVPVNDGDAITGTPWSEQVNGIQFMVPMPLGLVTFTGNSVQQVGAPGSFASSPQAITPANQVAAPQSSIGSSATLKPRKIDWDILYWEPDNGTLRDLTYQLFFNIYTGNDLSWPSSHLTTGTGHQIIDAVWARKPNKLLWAARDDGILLSLTYLKEQDVAGWARHTTQGQVKSLCAVTELPVDALYMVVSRTGSDGQPRFLIERMDNRIWQGVEDSWCVDAGVSLSLSTPNASLFASFASGGNVAFLVSPALWSPGNVGQLIRMGGGIAVIDSYQNAGQVSGHWLFPCQQTVPDSPTNAVIPQLAGQWSLAAPVSRVVGLNHLLNQTVTGLADGIPIPPRAVTTFADGTVGITLDRAASNVVVGLGFSAQLQSVYLDTGQPTVQGRRKAIPAVTARLENSYPILQAGANQPDASALSPPPVAVFWALPPARVEQPSAIPATYATAAGGTVQPLFTGDVRLTVPADWKKPGQVCVQQALPLPLNVLALVPEVLDGDLPEVALEKRQPSRRAA